MNEKEMLMKQLRANAFPHNNGKVMQLQPLDRCTAGGADLGRQPR